MKRRSVVAALILCLLITLLPPAAAAKFSDMPRDYSTEALQAAVDNGLLNGWDGKIFPDDPLTRAQMAAIVVRAFGATREASLTGFEDVSESDWFYLDMARAVHMKVIQGDGKRLMPNDPITRQQAFTILARALRLEEGTRADLAAFSDAWAVADWAVGSVAAMVKAGYVHGADGQLLPTANIRRKDFAVMMHNIFKKYVRESTVVTAVPQGSILVSAPGVTFRNVTIQGDLVLGDGVGSGDVVLDNVDVRGRLVVRGGGVNSIIIRGGSSVGTVVVSKVDGRVRVLVEGGADVEVIQIDDGRDDVIIQGDVEKVVVQASGVPVVLRGSADQVAVHGSEATVTVEGSVGTITTAETAQNTSIRVSESGSVNTVNASGYGTTVSGDGTVESVHASASNVRVSTVGTRVTASPGTAGVLAGSKPVAPGQTVTVEDSGSSGGGGGGGGGGGTTVNLRGVSIQGSPRVGEKLAAVVSPSDANVTYQWQRAGTQTGAYVDIPNATGEEYTLTLDDANMWIRVRVRGKGSTTGTATSDATGPVRAAQLRWSQVSGADVDIGTVAFSQNELTIEAVTGTPIYLAIRAENVGSVPYSARCVITGDDVDEGAFAIEAVKAYTASGGGYTAAQSPQVSFDEGFVFDLSNFAAGQVRVVIVRLTPKSAGTYRINVFAAR